MSNIKDVLHLFVQHTSSSCSPNPLLMWRFQFNLNLLFMRNIVLVIFIAFYNDKRFTSTVWIMVKQSGPKTDAEERSFSDLIIRQERNRREREWWSTYLCMLQWIFWSRPTVISLLCLFVIRKSCMLCWQIGFFMHTVGSTKTPALTIGLMLNITSYLCIVL